MTMTAAISAEPLAEEEFDVLNEDGTKVRDVWHCDDLLDHWPGGVATSTAHLLA
jgi:hypothetical protein